MSFGPTSAISKAIRAEILAGVFSSEEITSDRVFLTKEQRSQIGELSREQVLSGLVARYVITRDGQVVGRAYCLLYTSDAADE